MRIFLIYFLVLALVQQANSLSCQIIDQQLPENDTDQCTPGFSFVATGVTAKAFEQYTFIVGSSECGTFSQFTQYIGSGTFIRNKTCLVSHGGQGDVKLQINGSIIFSASGSCNCTGYATISCTKKANLGLIIGLVIGGVVVVGAIGFIVYRKFLRKPQIPGADYQTMPN